jgi:hypothetical protein
MFGHFIMIVQDDGSEKSVLLPDDDGKTLSETLPSLHDPL